MADLIERISDEDIRALLDRKDVASGRAMLARLLSEAASDLNPVSVRSREPIEHELKTHPDPFTEVWNGRKRFEFRLNDRDYRVGDTLRLREWVPDGAESDDDGFGLAGRYTGRIWCGRVTYALYGPDFGVPEGYVVMSLEPLGAL